METDFSLKMLYHNIKFTKNLPGMLHHLTYSILDSRWSCFSK